MKKQVIYFLILNLNMIMCHSQSLIGNYIGQKNELRSYTQNKKKKIIHQQIEYIDKNLNLNNDSTFTFEYFSNCGLCNSQGGYQKQTKGIWTFSHDTLYLTSTFQDEDFFEVKESYIPSLEPKLIKIMNVSEKDSPDDSLTISKILHNTQHYDTDWFSGRIKVSIYFTVGSSSQDIGICKENDTLYSKGIPLKIVVSTHEGYRDIQISYIPKDSKSNSFEFKLKGSVEGQNIWFKRDKLVLVKNEFKSLDYYGDLSVGFEKLYHKQKILKK